MLTHSRRQITIFSRNGELGSCAKTEVRASPLFSGILQLARIHFLFEMFPSPLSPYLLLEEQGYHGEHNIYLFLAGTH